MATAESVKKKIQGLIDTANETTGGADTDLTTAVGNLVAGFGQTSDPILEELAITENGEYMPSDGVDGFSKVIANIVSSASGGGATLLESGIITVASTDAYKIQELSETPDLVLVYAETEITASSTAGCIMAVLPIDILPTDTTPTGAISNFIAMLRYLNGNITNSGEVSNAGIYLADGVPYIRFVRISSSYPFIDGDYRYETYKLWS